MKKHHSNTRKRSVGGFTLVETMIASAGFSVVMGVIMMGFVSFSRVNALATDYAMARLTLSDYMNMDLRRSTDFQPTIIKDVTRGGWLVDEWGLPAVIFVPNFISSTGTPNQPVKVSLSATDWEAAKDAAIARGKLPPPNWAVGYGSSATARMVVYEQANGIITRREGWGTATRPTATSSQESGCQNSAAERARTKRAASVRPVPIQTSVHNKPKPVSKTSRERSFNANFGAPLTFENDSLFVV